MPRIKMHEHAADIEIYLNKYRAEKKYFFPTSFYHPFSMTALLSFDS